MVYDHQNWREKAACRTLNTEVADSIFFLTVGKSAKAARLFCNGCEVQSQCRDYAIYYGESGIWGGMTDDERDALRSGLMGLLTEARLVANGVAINETREQTQWGLGTVQIQESRQKFAAPVESKPQLLNQQPPMLVIQL